MAKAFQPGRGPGTRQTSTNQSTTTAEEEPAAAALPDENPSKAITRQHSHLNAREGSPAERHESSWARPVVPEQCKRKTGSPMDDDIRDSSKPLTSVPGYGGQTLEITRQSTTVDDFAYDYNLRPWSQAIGRCRDRRFQGRSKPSRARNRYYFFSRITAIRPIAESRFRGNKTDTLALDREPRSQLAKRNVLTRCRFVGERAGAKRVRARV